MAIFLFNFKKQFAPRVESGEKRQTIRQNRKDGRRPVPGDIAKCYTGLRTRSVRLLRTETVTNSSGVVMDMFNEVIAVDGCLLGHAEARDFAIADGFDSKSSMFNWFREQYKTNLFEGFCVRWKPTNNHG